MRAALGESRVRADGYWGEDLSALCEETFGSKIYANMMLLGAACQLGQLPFSVSTLEEAVRRSVSSDDRDVNPPGFSARAASLVAYPETFYSGKKEPDLPRARRGEKPLFIGHAQSAPRRASIRCWSKKLSWT